MVFPTREREAFLRGMQHNASIMDSGTSLLTSYGGEVHSGSKRLHYKSCQKGGEIQGRATIGTAVGFTSVRQVSSFTYHRGYENFVFEVGPEVPLLKDWPKKFEMVFSHGNWNDG
ncbi:hypothetical protein H5410_055654 [Solanum commersonii]|uniref:Uncharacterized protein n=1 Tax=Solanum commersonii TaxID=4109 RepID=A0A9J5WKG3_SOLCO|nr:hypothetical protein H5410_055654 [Solanum commersonii]